MTTTSNPLHVFTRVVEDAFNTGDVAILDELISSDFVEHQFATPTDPHRPTAPQPSPPSCGNSDAALRVLTSTSTKPRTTSRPVPACALRRLGAAGLQPCAARLRE